MDFVNIYIAGINFSDFAITCSIYSKIHNEFANFAKSSIILYLQTIVSDNSSICYYGAFRNR